MFADVRIIHLLDENGLGVLTLQVYNLMFNTLNFLFFEFATLIKKIGQDN